MQGTEAVVGLWQASVRGSKLMFSCSYDFGKYTLLDASDGRVLAVLADRRHTAAMPVDAVGACIC